MQRDRFASSLRHLGLDDSNYQALELLPLVYVAWASGSITPERQARLLDLARDHFDVGEAGERVLLGWLHERPTPAYFRDGLHELLLVARAPDDWAVDSEQLPSLIAYSEAVARANAGAMDAPSSVSESEQQALRELNELLEVDEGVPWAAVLRGLEAPPGAGATRGR